MALVFAQLGERRLRTGIAALLDRRLVAPHALRRFLQSGPRNLTAAVACDAAAVRLRDIFASARDGLDGFLNDGPCHHPQFAMLADDIRALVAGLKCPRSDLPSPPAPRPSQARTVPDHASREQQAAFRHLIDRLRAYFLTQEGKPRGERFHRHAVQCGGLRYRGRLAPPSRHGGAAGSAGGRRYSGIPPRSQRRHVARRLADLRGRAAAVSAHARVARAARFLRRPRARGPAAEGHGRVRREPPPPRSAPSSRARRRVPGHQPRAVGARAAAREELGRRIRRGRRCDPAVDLHRRRPEAVHLRIPRRRRRGGGRGGAVHRCAASGRPPAAGDHGQLPIGAGDPGVRERRLRRDRRRRGDGRASRCLPIRGGGQVSGESARSA